MRKFFKVDDSDFPEKQEIVAVYDNERVIGLMVDKILGSNQTVIKPIGRLFNNCTGINSSTVLGDGSVALILDVLKLTELLKSIEKKEKAKKSDDSNQNEKSDKVKVEKSEEKDEGVKNGNEQK